MKTRILPDRSFEFSFAAVHTPFVSGVFPRQRAHSRDKEVHDWFACFGDIALVGIDISQSCSDFTFVCLRSSASWWADLPLRK
jgi:hypothetical protein